MKFGVRECADVVLRAKSAQKIGNKIFYKNEPVCYFDTLKTSTFEGAATTVYAQGGRGNARLMSWDGERTVTFTMEDALISPIGLSILTGAGLINATATKPVIQHVTENLKNTLTETATTLTLKEVPYAPTGEDCTIYVMGLNDHGEVMTEPYYYEPTEDGAKTIQIAQGTAFGTGHESYSGPSTATPPVALSDCESLLVDYYTQHTSGAYQVNISAEQFGGTFYLEASTVWRDQGTGKDLPAEFIIPSCKVQSNFSFTLASTGDPSSFTFTMDAFPDFTRWDTENKVLAAIQVIGASLDDIDEPYRTETWSNGL